MPILWMKSLGVTTQNISVSLTVTVLWEVCFSVFYGKKKIHFRFRFDFAHALLFCVFLLSRRGMRKIYFLEILY